MKIGIADPQSRVRFSLRVLLEERGWEVCGEAADCKELFDLLRNQTLDLILVDMDLNDLPPEELLCLLRMKYRQVRFIAMHWRQEYAQAAMAAGADAFVCKAEPPEKLLNLIRELEDS